MKKRKRGGRVTVRVSKAEWLAKAVADAEPRLKTAVTAALKAERDRLTLTDREPDIYDLLDDLREALNRIEDEAERRPGEMTADGRDGAHVDVDRIQAAVKDATAALLAIDRGIADGSWGLIPDNRDYEER